jgi:hypothetical protein
MKRPAWVVAVVWALGLAGSPPAFGQLVSAIVSPPIDHPVLLNIDRPALGAWTRATGAWGEGLVNESLKLRGYQVYEIKGPGNRGIDRLAMKRNLAGDLIDVRFIEIKTTRGGPARMVSTKSGRQMSRTWLAQHLRSMRSSGDPIAKPLAAEIRHFYRASKVTPEMLGEVHDINTRTGRYIRRNPVTMAELSNESIERQLEAIQTKSPSAAARRSATRHLGRYDQIRSTSMTIWLGRGHAAKVVSRGGSLAAARASSVGAARGLGRMARFAGPIGAAAAVAIDAHEMYAVTQAYRAGDVTRRQLVQQLSSTGGGMLGAAGGAATGAWIGAFGGPFVWVTVPVGAGVGGIAGYFAGSHVGDAIASGWYGRIDDRVKSQVDAWLVRRSSSFIQGPGN